MRFTIHDSRFTLACLLLAAAASLLIAAVPIGDVTPRVYTLPTNATLIASTGTVVKGTVSINAYDLVGTLATFPNFPAGSTNGLQFDDGAGGGDELLFDD